MANDFSRLESEVTEINDAADAAVALLNGISAQLREHAGDPAKISSLADQLDSAGTRLAEAVVANTPADTGGGDTGGGETGGGETGGGTGGGEPTPPSFRSR